MAKRANPASRNKWPLRQRCAHRQPSVEIMEIFQRLNDQGLTIVLVTHELDVAHFAKRTLVLRDGKIRKDEPLLNRPSPPKY